MSRIRIPSVLLTVLFCGGVALPQVLHHSELREDARNLIQGEQQLQRVIDVGPGTRERASIEVTSKGNGLLSIGKLRLKVVDGHDDGASYQDEMAHVEFADVDGDGWKDLVIVGIANYTDDKGDAILKREPFTFIYKYDPQRKSFGQTYRFASFALEQGPESLSAAEESKLLKERERQGSKK